jgi:DNA-binding IclR family transcriptional regulator
MRRSPGCSEASGAEGELVRPGRAKGADAPEAIRPADDTLKSLAKIARLLDCFSTSTRALSVAEICERTGYPRSTTHRLLASMKEVGFLDQDRQRDRYRLGLKLFEYGNIVLANMELHREARPFVEQLSRVTGHLVHLAVFDGRRAVVIHRVDPLPEGAAPVTLEQAPVHCTGVGKAILAFQPDTVIDQIIGHGLRRYSDATVMDGKRLREEIAAIRRRGYAVDNGEHEPGIRCVGAPIRDQQGRVVAGISISGPSLKIEDERIPALAEIVVHNAKAISARL